MTWLAWVPVLAENATGGVGALECDTLFHAMGWVGVSGWSSQRAGMGPSMYGTTTPARVRLIFTCITYLLDDLMSLFHASSDISSTPLSTTVCTPIPTRQATQRAHHASAPAS